MLWALSDIIPNSLMYPRLLPSCRNRSPPTPSPLPSSRTVITDRSISRFPPILPVVRSMLLYSPPSLRSIVPSTVSACAFMLPDTTEPPRAICPSTLAPFRIMSVNLLPWLISRLPPTCKLSASIGPVTLVPLKFTFEPICAPRKRISENLPPRPKCKPLSHLQSVGIEGA